MQFIFNTDKEVIAEKEQAWVRYIRGIRFAASSIYNGNRAVRGRVDMDGSADFKKKLIGETKTIKNHNTDNDLIEKKDEYGNTYYEFVNLKIYYDKNEKTFYSVEK